MSVLGVVLAGGRSIRFGSDKAVALLDGERLIDRVVAALRPQVAAVIVVGRDEVGDRPAGGLGPLGGLNAALHRARAEGLEWVASVPCDAPLFPPDLIARLRGTDPAFAEGMPVIGWWPAVLADRLDDHLAAGGDRSMRGWAAAVGARAVDVGTLANVNTPADLARLSGGSPAPPPA